MRRIDFKLISCVRKQPTLKLKLFSLWNQMLFVGIFDIMQIPALLGLWLKSDNHEYADIIISHEILVMTWIDILYFIYIYIQVSLFFSIFYTISFSVLFFLEIQLKAWKEIQRKYNGNTTETSKALFCLFAQHHNSELHSGSKEQFERNIFSFPNSTKKSNNCYFKNLNFDLPS